MFQKFFNKIKRQKGITNKNKEQGIKQRTLYVLITMRNNKNVMLTIVAFINIKIKINVSSSYLYLIRHTSLNE